MAAERKSSRGTVIATCYGSLVVGFLAAAVIPYLRASDHARADIAESSREIAVRQDKQLQLETVKKSIELLELETANYDQLVPANDDYGSFVTQVSDCLQAAGMKDIALSALPPTPLGKAQRKPIEIKGKGTFEQVHAFLISMEGLKRKSSVGKLTIEADTDMNGSVKAAFTVFIYSTNNAVKPGA
jgi:hypothetical protein